MRFWLWLIDERGAVSADWLILGASLTAMALALILSVSDGASQLGTLVEATLAAAQVTPISLPTR